MRQIDPSQGLGGNAEADAPARRWMQERIRTVVSGTIRGRLIYQEPVKVEGRISGELSSTELVVIAEIGSFQGVIRTPKLLILGAFEGNVIGAKEVVLGAQSRVKANVRTESLVMHEGARLDGEIHVIGPEQTGAASVNPAMQDPSLRSG